MATHDYVIDNQSAPSARSDINNVLQAIVTNNSGTSAPSVTYAGMWWLDTTNNQMKLRDKDNADWVIVGELDVTNDRWKLISDSLKAASAGGIDVLNSSGTKIIDLQVASQATAEAGINNTELMTPLRSKQLIDQELGNVAPPNSNQNSTGTAFNSGLSTRNTVTITPSSTSAKILVMGSMTADSADDSVEIQLRRDGSILTGTLRKHDFREIRSDGVALTRPGSISTQYLDAPSTTSQVTYTLECDIATNNSNIIVFEV